MREIGLGLMLLGMFFWSVSAYSGSVLPQAKQEVSKAISVRQKAQASQDKWLAEQRVLVEECESLMKEIEVVKSQNLELLRQRDSLRKSIELLHQKIEKGAEISQGILPFLQAVKDRLDRFIAMDLPFLDKERGERMIRLQEALDDTSLSVSEKYRRTMEALFIETEYGSTVGLDEGSVVLEGHKISGHIFRLGRLAMFFRSPDKKIYAYYDQKGTKWLPVDRGSARHIEKAMEIVQKIRPTTIVKLPLGRVRKSHEP